MFVRKREEKKTVVYTAAVGPALTAAKNTLRPSDRLSLPPSARSEAATRGTKPPVCKSRVI